MPSPAPTNSGSAGGRGGVYGWTVCVAAYILFRGLSGGLPELLPRVVETVTGGVGYFYPVAGWLSMAVGGGLTGEGGVLMGFGLCALYLAALLWILCKAKPDYYEDVLQSAEVSQSAINARKEGGMAEAAPQRVRLGRKGLNQGWGAGVIFVKHRIENRRTRKLLLSTNVLIFALMTIAMAFFLRGAGVMPIFGISVYTQIFTSMMGRLNLELRKPYLYLIPEPPMKKMLWALAEQFPAGLIEVLVVFVPVGVLMGLSPAMFAICVVARLSYTFLFAAANVAVDRLWGGVTSAVLVRLLFLAVAVAMALPGFIVGVIVSIATGFGAAAGLLAAMACNLPLGLLCLFLCRDMLQYAELNQQ